jgi:AAA15 family ATPase/GTPase
MIEHIKIENLAHLAPIDFSPGQVNVVIGKNDTGKTLLIKYLYAYAKMMGKISQFKGQSRDYLESTDIDINVNEEEYLKDFLDYIVQKHNENKDVGLNKPFLDDILREYNTRKFKSDDGKISKLSLESEMLKIQLSIFLLGMFKYKYNYRLGQLVSRFIINDERLSSTIRFANGSIIRTSISENATSQIDVAEFTLNSLDLMNCVFIPTKEVISMATKIVWLRNQSEFSSVFDDTYFDLALELISPELKGEEFRPFTAVDELLENALEGRIVRQTDNPSQPFIFQKGDELFDLNLVSEGIKKFGIFNVLLQNRNIRPGTIIFIDEPETALHPEALRTFIKALFMLANNGVQVFMATHNYFVLKQSELCAREAATKYPNVKSALCISLEKAGEKSKLVQPTYHDLKEGMPPNPIVDESLKMYYEDLDQSLGVRDEKVLD